jgi:protein-S-isoprenylcysteine O-methyltransferase Ste14
VFVFFFFFSVSTSSLALALALLSLSRALAALSLSLSLHRALHLAASMGKKKIVALPEEKKRSLVLSSSFSVLHNTEDLTIK